MAIEPRTPSDPPLVSVIIVTWNVRGHALTCLDALFARADGVPLEVFVVDNASSDGTVEAVRARFPMVTVLENEDNVGFPLANNQALAMATGEYVLFLNPDTEVGPGTIRRCVDELERRPDVGMVGCRLMYPDGTVQYEGARRAYRLRHLFAESFYLHMFFPRSPVFAHQIMGDWDHRGTRDVEAICGAFMLARRAVALEVGGLPDEVFMYHEDLAFCLRIRRAGHRIRYLADVETVHDANRSSVQSASPLVLLEGEAKLRLIREAEGRASCALGRALFAFRSLLRLAIAAAGAVLPRGSRLRRRYPKVFDMKRHWLQLRWAISPRLVARLMPRAPERPAAPRVHAAGRE